MSDASTVSEARACPPPLPDRVDAEREFEPSSRTGARANLADRHVGGRIRERRVMLGLSQQQLAQLIGVTYQQAHKYERGLNRISAGRLYEMAQVLSVPVSWFFEGLATELAAGRDEPAPADVS